VLRRCDEPLLQRAHEHTIGDAFGRCGVRLVLPDRLETPRLSKEPTSLDQIRLLGWEKLPPR
jgi:hypothetical protein